MVLVLRGVGAFSRVESVVKSRGPHQQRVSSEVALDKIMSATPEMAYRFVKICYFLVSVRFSKISNQAEFKGKSKVRKKFGD